MTEHGFEELVAALQARGYSRVVAEDYACRLGDTIEEQDGKWVIRGDDGQVIDRIETITDG